MSLYTTPEMDIMLYAMGGGRPGVTGPGGDNSGGDDVVETSGDLDDAGGAYACNGIGPTDCSNGGGSWFGGGCSAGEGSSGGSDCNGSTSSKGGVT